MSAFRIALFTVAALFLSLSPRASAQPISPGGKTYEITQKCGLYSPPFVLLTIVIHIPILVTMSIAIIMD